MKKILISIVLLISMSGCSWLSTTLTPPEVIDAVARAEVLAKVAAEMNIDDIQKEDLKNYLRVNAELWRELAIWFEIREQ